jgi:hypothetical protein
MIFGLPSKQLLKQDAVRCVLITDNREPAAEAIELPSDAKNNDTGIVSIKDTVTFVFMQTVWSGEPYTCR